MCLYVRKLDCFAPVTVGWSVAAYCCFDGFGRRLPDPFVARACAAFQLVRLSEAPLRRLLALFTAFRYALVCMKYKVLFEDVSSRELAFVALHFFVEGAEKLADHEVRACLHKALPEARDFAADMRLAFVR